MREPKSYLIEIAGQMPDAIYERALREVVRCRDCKMFDEHYLKCFRPVLYFDHDYMPHWTDETTFIAVTDATPDGFCKWGERES